MRKLVTSAVIALLVLVVRIAWNLVTAEPIPEPTEASRAAEAAEFDGLVAKEVESGAAAPPAAGSATRTTCSSRAIRRPSRR